MQHHCIHERLSSIDRWCRAALTAFWARWGLARRPPPGRLCGAGGHGVGGAMAPWGSAGSSFQPAIGGDGRWGAWWSERMGDAEASRAPGAGEWASPRYGDLWDHTFRKKWNGYGACCCHEDRTSRLKNVAAQAEAIGLPLAAPSSVCWDILQEHTPATSITGMRARGLP